MKRTFILAGVFCTMLGLPYVRGQSIGPQTLNATGGTFNMGSNVFDWSIGEMSMVSTFSGPAIILTQGLLQNETMLSVSGINDTHLQQWVRVFPNPASSVLNLQFTTSSTGTVTYAFMDITGRVLISKSVPVVSGRVEEQLNISAFAAAPYLLEVTITDEQAGAKKTSYKIDKLK